MITLEEMEQNLNSLYALNPVEYMNKLNSIKNTGYKVYRNPQGKHKIRRNGDFLSEVFGGVFGDIFN